jgi:hypothetical protein
MVAADPGAGAAAVGCATTVGACLCILVSAGVARRFGYAALYAPGFELGLDTPIWVEVQHQIGRVGRVGGYHLDVCLLLFRRHAGVAVFRHGTKRAYNPLHLQHNPPIGGRDGQATMSAIARAALRARALAFSSGLQRAAANALANGIGKLEELLFWHGRNAFFPGVLRVLQQKEP